jgi:hypothetical protein
MIPASLHVKSEPVLAIVMDSFSDKKNKQENVSLIERIQMDASSDIDVVLFDRHFSIENIEIWISKTVSLLRAAAISPSNFALCNFLRFSHPNHVEYLMESKLPDAIERTLYVHGVEYVPCFYQWYGYLKPMYNFVFVYHKYRYMMGISEILKTANKLKMSDPLTVYEIGYIYDNSSDMTMSFWKNTVCFMDYGNPNIAETEDDINSDIFASLMNYIRYTSLNI